MAGSKENSLEEEALWRGIQQGDQVAFEKVYNQYFKNLYNYGRKICSNKSILEDAIHDLFLDLWRYHTNLSATTSIKFYLYRALRRRIVRNEIKDIESSVFDFNAGEAIDKRAFSFEEQMIDEEASTERSSKLKKHMESLPIRQYEALILRFYDEFTYEEIAVMLEVNDQSARNLVQRGLQQLRGLAKILLLMAALFSLVR